MAARGPALIAALLVAALGARSAPAEPAHARSAAPAVRTPPEPAVSLSLEAPTARGPWTIRLANDGPVPLRIAADARLVSLELRARGTRAPERCELPADMRPTDDLDLATVLLPGRSYSERFEPRLYCFGDAKLAALASGTIVTARLGWAGRASDPPFAVSPIDGVEPAVAPMKAVEALPIALPGEPSGWMGRTETDAPDPADDAPRLSLEGPAAVDASTPDDIPITVTLHNDGSHAVLVRFRPDLLSFDLIGPGGVEHCTWPVMPGAALREMFTALPPKGSDTLSVTLNSYCTGHGLDVGGLLVVRPRFDTRQASGAAIGLHAFDGELMAERPTIVRLHRGAVPYKSRVRPGAQEGEAP